MKVAGEKNVLEKRIRGQNYKDFWAKKPIQGESKKNRGHGGAHSCLRETQSPERRTNVGRRNTLRINKDHNLEKLKSRSQGSSATKKSRADSNGKKKVHLNMEGDNWGGGNGVGGRHGFQCQPRRR